MARRKDPPRESHVFDPQAIRELARCFARAAVDEMFAEQEREASPDQEPTQAQGNHE